jgi:hypothetical protein
MIETAEPGGNERETSETMRSGPAGVEYSFERFSTLSKQNLQPQMGSASNSISHQKAQKTQMVLANILFLLCFFVAEH